MYLSGYNVVGELISFILAILVLFLMVNSNPRRTKLLIFDRIGIVVSIVAIWIQIALAVFCSYPERYNKRLFDGLCLSYLILYMIVLILLISYINLLDAKNWLHARGYIWTVAVSSVMYLVIVVSLLQAGKMYEVTGQGIRFRLFMPTYLSFGMAACLLCLIINWLGRKTFPKIVNKYITIFVLADFALLVLQLRHQEMIFSSLTYVLPFMIFYVMLHNNPYDGFTGCQNKEALDAVVARCIQRHLEFSLIYIVLPQIKKMDTGSRSKKVEQTGWETLRRIESLHKHMRMYRMDNGTFALFLQDKNSMPEGYLTQLKTVLDEASAKTMLYYKMIVVKSHPLLKNLQMFKSLAYYMLDKSRNNTDESKSYYVSPQDYEDFYRNYKIEQTLLDIQNKMNLDDERVLCYMQPIYSVKTASFRTAEALMRLKIEDEIINPVDFLDIAEKNNCMHSLTRIMLNKVCKRIHEVQDTLDFDAITVNCSAEELSDWSLHEQLLSIIRTNGIDTSKIRLELTERAMFTDYNAVIHNIDKLNQAGVKFYLDDFGTGYSNLERIISCPFHTIKFDKTLLYKAVNDSSVDDLVAHMVSVFKKNGFVLLVEGVEDSKQDQYSIEKGFDYIQGFKYAHPVPAKEISEYFAKK